MVKCSWPDETQTKYGKTDGWKRQCGYSMATPLHNLSKVVGTGYIGTQTSRRRLRGKQVTTSTERMRDHFVIGLMRKCDFTCRIPINDFPWFSQITENIIIVYVDGHSQVKQHKS